MSMSFRMRLFGYYSPFLVELGLQAQSQHAAYGNMHCGIERPESSIMGYLLDASNHRM